MCFILERKNDMLHFPMETLLTTNATQLMWGLLLGTADHLLHYRVPIQFY